MATEEKNNIVYETDSSNCEFSYWNESDGSFEYSDLKLRSNEHINNCDCGRIKLRTLMGSQS